MSSAVLARILEEGIPRAAVDKLRAKWLAEKARRLGSKDFASFVKQAWSVIDAAPLIWNWHLEALCVHLEAVARGEIKRLVINIPPGFGKSIIVAVLWPAWIWAYSPQKQLVCTSYGADQAKRDAVKMRDLICSSWYQQTFVGGRWALKDDMNTKALYENTAHGHRVSCGVTEGTGKRADIVILDDPLKAQEAHSAATREEAERFLSTASTRFNNAEEGVMVMIMQRLREDDTTGFVLAGGGWEHLRLPAEFEAQNPCVTFHTVAGERKMFWKDPREIEGELLFEEKFPVRVLERLKRPNELGDFGYAGQFQQRPAPAGGGIFKLEDWRFFKMPDEWREKLGYPDTPIRPMGCAKAELHTTRELDMDALDETIISVDGAGGAETKDGSYTVIQVWGRLGSRRLLLYAVRRRMDFTDTVKTLKEVIALFPEARRKLIEAKASGSSIINTLDRLHGVIGIEPINPGKRSKEERARAMQPYQKSGNIELPVGAPWVNDHVAEHAAFPRGSSDDQVDCESQGLEGLENGPTAADFWSTADGSED